MEKAFTNVSKNNLIRTNTDIIKNEKVSEKVLIQKSNQLKKVR
jgi:hypothetical protein